MLDAGRMKDSCRICGRELCGNQRRWIFHPGTRPSLRVLLSHALGRELSRDGRGEFACSKCAFMLERMYRFDTVIARVEAMSLERLQRLLLEKERLRQSVGGLYRRTNPGEAGATEDPRDASYSDLIQEDLVFSEYESWADREEPDQNLLLHHHQCTGAEPGQKQRRCRGCAALRVADSDYEAVCKVPRSVGRRSTSCGPPTRYSAAVLVPEELGRTSEAASVPLEADKRSHSPASSVESLEIHTNPRTEEEPEPEPEPEEASVPGLETLLGGLRGWEYRPLKPPRGSRLPVLVRARLDPSIPEVVVLCPEQEELLEELEEPWLDDYLRCAPFRFQQVDHNRDETPNSGGPTGFKLLVTETRVYPGEKDSGFNLHINIPDPRQFISPPQYRYPSNQDRCLDNVLHRRCSDKTVYPSECACAA